METLKSFFFKKTKLFFLLFSLVLVNQLHQNAKLKIFDELVISKFQEFLDKFPELETGISPSQIQEMILMYTFDIYNDSLELAKCNRLPSAQSPAKLYISKLRQISCDLIYLCIDIEQNFNKSVEESETTEKDDSDSYFELMLKENPEIFYELLKLILRTCILLLSDLNKNEEIIFRDLSLARMIYAQYMVYPSGSEQNLIDSALKGQNEKLQIIGLFYLLDLELSMEVVENVSMEILIQSFQKVFDLLESSEGCLLDSGSKSKLFSIYIKTLVKILKKDGFSAKPLENLFAVSMENGKLRKCFKWLENDKNFDIFKKLVILFKLENNQNDLEGFQEILFENIERENSKENELFCLAMKAKSFRNNEMNEDFMKNFKERFVNLLNDYEASCEEIFPVLEIIKSLGNQTFLFELLSILLKNLPNFQNEFIEGFMIYFLNIIEEAKGKTHKIMTENMDLLLKVFETRKLKPKILLFFIQKILKLVIFLSFSENAYSESCNILDKILFSLQSQMQMISKNICFELLYVQLNNAIMLKNKNFATKVFNDLKDHGNNSFLQSLIELKYKFFMNSSKTQLTTDLKNLFHDENFDFALFMTEIMGFALDSGQIKIILETFLEMFKRNSESSISFFQNFIEKNKENLCLFSFFQPLIEEFSTITEQTKDLFIGKFSQEKVKILINLINFIEDIIHETIFGKNEFEKSDISWIANDSAADIFEGIFWNLM